MISIFCIIDNTPNTIKSFISNNLKSIINQTFKEWELIIYIDNVLKEDRTVYDYIYKIISLFDIFKNNKIKMLQDNSYSDKPTLHFLNCFYNCLSIANANYQFIAFYDMNDNWHPMKLESQLKYVINPFENQYQNPYETNLYDVVGCSSIFGKGITSIQPNNNLDKINFYTLNPFINSSTILKKKSFHENKDVIIESELSLYLHNKNNFFAYMWLLFAVKQMKMYNMNDVLLKHEIQNNPQNSSNTYFTNDFEIIKNVIKDKYIRIRFFSDFCSSNDCKKNYEKICKSNEINFYGPKKHIYFSHNNTFSHAIVLNSPIIPNLENHVDKKNILYLAFEPPNAKCLNLNNKAFMHYAMKHIGKYFIGSTSNLPSPPFVGHHGFMWFNSPSQFIIPSSKNKLISMMVSHKTSTFGHRYRHKLVEQLLLLQLPIDIYGSGYIKLEQKFGKNPRIKGAFNDSKVMYENYMFTISIENTEYDHYFSEKVIDPFMFKTVPIYWGCKNIENYFPNQVIHLSGNVENDIELIKNILKNPEDYLKIINSQMIFDKLNLIKNIDTIFS